MNGLIAIVGPTAVGKSKLSINLAPKFHGEIINADSRQVYRYLDIGTAKPSALERNNVNHHLIDILNPEEPYSLAIYQKDAYDCLYNIQKRGNLPFLVGGTGQYIWAVLEGWTIPPVPPNSKYREYLEKKVNNGDRNVLFNQLKELDPQAAQKILPTNIRRIIRALEIIECTGKPASSFWHKNSPPFRYLIIGLTMERSLLYKAIDYRVDEMIKNGFIEEVHKLLEKGYQLDLPAMSGIGYKQISMYLSNEISLLDAIQLIKNETHKFCRRQYNWFSLNNSKINWFDVNDDIYDKIINTINNFTNNLGGDN